MSGSSGDHGGLRASMRGGRRLRDRMRSHTTLSEGSGFSDDRSDLRRSGDSVPGSLGHPRSVKQRGRGSTSGNSPEYSDLRTSGDSASSYHLNHDDLCPDLRQSGDSEALFDTDFSDLRISGDSVPEEPTSVDHYVVDDASAVEDSLLDPGLYDAGFEADPRCSDWLLSDRYVAGSVIGEGAYGSVRRVLDKSAGMVVAAKRTKEVFSGETTRCRRVLREVVVLAQLCHSNVVRLLDVPFLEEHGPADELYMVMECCDTDLQKLCLDRRGLTPMQARKLSQGLLAGCAYLHSRGLVHRDLKPANCLANRDCTVKVCDFNLVCSRERALATSSPSQCRPASRSVRPGLTKCVATRWYRSPEVLLQLPYAEAMDVWSAACIIAELLRVCMTPTGKHAPLFRGGPCFPLSGDCPSNFVGDQLDAIFNVIGTPTCDQLNQVVFGGARIRLACYKARPGAGIASLLRPLPCEHEADDVVGLLEHMLKFAPGSRITMEEAFRHPFVSRGLGVNTTLADRKPILDVEHFMHLPETGWPHPWQLRCRLQEELARLRSASCAVDSSSRS